MAAGIYHHEGWDEGSSHDDTLSKQKQIMNVSCMERGNIVVPKCKFSILVVSLNAGDKLLQTIESIENQSFSDYEIIVKDGGSTDGSIQRLMTGFKERHSKITIYHDADTSIYDAMNQAAKKASGEYFLFINCGDMLYDNKVLEQLAEKIEADGGKNSRLFYGDVYFRMKESHVPSNPRISGFDCYRHVPCHQACIYHRSLFAERGYETDYRVRADHEYFLWCYFIKKANPKYLPVVVASYEGGGFSETRENRSQSRREHRKIMAKYMSLGKRIWYRLILVVTLAPIRGYIAANPRTAGLYQQCKERIYRLRK